MTRDNKAANADKSSLLIPSVWIYPLFLCVQRERSLFDLPEHAKKKFFHLIVQKAQTKKIQAGTFHFLLFDCESFLTVVCFSLNGKASFIAIYFRGQFDAVACVGDYKEDRKRQGERVKDKSFMGEFVSALHPQTLQAFMLQAFMLV
ncbi:MAG: hypothetical protein NC400_06735 [Clostridium sp.]|nr:hypothetical protein [Clostridium sp.]